jgi:hypothetical protein
MVLFIEHILMTSRLGKEVLKPGCSCKRKWSNNKKSIPVEHLEGIIIVLMKTPISEHTEDNFKTWKVSISEQQ